MLGAMDFLSCERVNKAKGNWIEIVVRSPNMTPGVLHAWRPPRRRLGPNAEIVQVDLVLNAVGKLSGKQTIQVEPSFCCGRLHSVVYCRSVPRSPLAKMPTRGGPPLKLSTKALAHLPETWSARTRLAR